MPILTHNKLWAGSEEKIVPLITWILTDIRRSKNIEKTVKFGWRIQHKPDKEDSEKKKYVLMKTNKFQVYIYPV